MLVSAVTGLRAIAQPLSVVQLIVMRSLNEDWSKHSMLLVPKNAKGPANSLGGASLVFSLELDATASYRAHRVHGNCSAMNDTAQA